MKSPVLILIPVLNELENLKILIPEILSLESNFNILIIDDSPNELTKNWVKFALDQNRVDLIHRQTPNGFVGSLLDGYLEASERSYKWLIQMDGDGQHPISNIEEIAQILTTNENDLIIGNRWSSPDKVKKFNLYRQLLSYIAKFYCRFFLGSRIQDWTSGFRGMTIEVALSFTRLQNNLNGFAFQALSASKALRDNKRILEIPISLLKRNSGKSKMSMSIIFEAVFTIYAHRNR